MKQSDVTEEHRLWGEAEDIRRKADAAEVKAGTMSYQDTVDHARWRRQQAGLTYPEANTCVRVAQIYAERKRAESYP